MLTQDEQLKANSLLRNELKQFSMAAIAKASGLELQQVAEFMDGNGVSEASIFIRLSLSHIVLKEAPQNDDCECPVCTLRRTGKIGGGVSVMELRLNKVEPPAPAQAKARFTLTPLIWVAVALHIFAVALLLVIIRKVVIL